MQISATYTSHFFSVIRGKMSVYAQLSKVRLSLLVVFSALMAFLYEQVPYTWVQLILLSVGGFLITAASNTINQIIEKDTDKLMTRTENRPIPSGSISVWEATVFAGVAGVAGIAILGYYFNSLSGLLGSLSLLSYAFIYTPFKKLSPASVFVGAIPGSMPLLIGATAAAGQITSGGIILFVIQFLWQIPHFWSIAWLLNSDYQKGGFNLLPSVNGKSREAALQNIPYLIMLLFVSFIPFLIGQVGVYALIFAFVAGMYFLYRGIQLAIDLTDKSAKQLMFASFIYIPVVQLSFVLDKL